MSGTFSQIDVQIRGYMFIEQDAIKIFDPVGAVHIKHKPAIHI